MRYELLPTKVSAVFFCRPDWDSLIPRRDKMKRQQRKDGAMIMLATLTNTDVHHASLLFERDGKSVTIATALEHRSKIVDSNWYYDNITKPKYIIELGTFDVSIKQIESFLKPPHRIRKWDMIIYAILTRYIFSTLLPNSCGLLSCQVLRMIGYKIKDIVIPRLLYTHLKKKHQPILWDDYIKERNQ